MRDVIVLIPGILGSVLARDGQDVWAPTPGAIGRGLWSLGRSVASLKIAQDPWESDDLGDGVTATRLVDDVHVVPGLWGIDGYSGLAAMIRDRFDVSPGRTYFELPYDWRRDNRVAARRLRRLADEALHRVRADDPGAKLILVGHSMGGLVARYFLECLEGWKDTRMLVTFGTPHRGSLNALDFLVNGFARQIGPLKVFDLTDFLRSLTSVYQLLPIYECVDVGRGDYARVAETGGALNGVDLVRAASALGDFHRAIEAGVQAHAPQPYAIHSVVGITQSTMQSARLVDGRLLVEPSYKGEDVGGDGTVPRVSATPIEMDDRYQPMYSSDTHGSLQNADPVRTQLVGVLSARPLGAFRDVSAVRVDVDGLVAAGDTLTVTATPDKANLDLAVVVTDLSTGRPTGAPSAMRRDENDVHHLELAPLPPGDYRVRVEGSGASSRLVDPVHGLVSVMTEHEPDPPLR